MYISVRVLNSTFAFDRPFDYLVPEKLVARVCIGVFVRVPFGKRSVEGVVVHMQEGRPSRKLKSVFALTGRPPILPDSLALAEWISERYVTLFSVALALVTPPRGAEAHPSVLPTSAHPILQTQGGTTYTGPLQKLLERAPHRSLIFGFFGDSQTARFEAYVDWIQFHPPGEGEKYLFGVPSVEDAQNLVSRITPHIDFPVDVYHSGLRMRDRRTVWESQFLSSPRIIVGTRSVLFLPLPGLKCIFVDEAENSAHGSERHPRYFAPDVAEHLAKSRGIPVVISGLVPRSEWAHRLSRGEIEDLVDGKWRSGHFSRAKVVVADLRHLRLPREKRLLSPTLMQMAERAIDAQKKIALIVSRKGFFTVAMCDSCEEIARCPQCDAPLAHVAAGRKLRCAHCTYAVADNLLCGHCHRGSMRFRGAGTERIERWVKKEIPRANILRLDRDTAPSHHELQTLLEDFSRGKGNVLIATPFVLRHLSRVPLALVGLLSPDFLLRFSDFRAPDNFMHLLAQAAASITQSGTLLLQTYLPDHPLYKMIAKFRMEKYWEEELANRKKHHYPPFGHIYVTTVEGKEKEQVQGRAEDLAREITRGKKKIFSDVVGPSPAFLAKRRGQYRYQILLKGRDITPMAQYLRALFAKSSRSRIRISADLDPSRIG